MSALLCAVTAMILSVHLSCCGINSTEEDSRSIG